MEKGKLLATQQSFGHDQIHNKKNQTCSLQSNLDLYTSTLSHTPQQGGGWSVTVTSNKILVNTKLKAFASYRLYVAQMLNSVFDRVENTVEKG